MATEQQDIEFTPGVNVYFSVWDQSIPHLIFDFFDNTFKAPAAPPTTPGLAATEDANMGGNANSMYSANLDLSLFADGSYLVSAYKRLGGAPAPITDDALALSRITIAGGQIIPDTLQPILVKFKAAYDALVGDDFHIIVWLERAGVKIALNGGDTCSVVVREGESIGPVQFTMTPAVDNAHDTFEGLQNAPNFNTASRVYKVDVTAVVGGLTFTGGGAFPLAT